MNRLITLLLRMGAPFGAMAVLTVEGRKSGLARSTPVAVVPHEGGWRLLAAAGIGDWVRNLRRAGEATLTFRGALVPVVSRELSPSEAAPVIRSTVTGAGALTRRFVAPHFSATATDPLERWEAEAESHPLFHLTPASLPTPRGGTALGMLTVALILGVVAQVALAGAGAFRTGGAWSAHGSLGVGVEAVALVTALSAIFLRRVGIRWLATAIFVLIAFQHGTAALGGYAGAVHAFNALLMLAAGSTMLRRLRAAHPLPAAPNVQVGQPLATSRM